MNPSDILTGANAALIAVILGVTGVLKSSFSDFFAGVLGQRLLPLIPLVMGTILAFLGMGSTGDATVASKLMVGLMSGVAASASFKVVKTSALGSGISDKSIKKQNNER